MDILLEEYIEAVIFGTGLPSSKLASFIRNKYNIKPTIISGVFPFLQYRFCKKITVPMNNPGLIFQAIKQMSSQNSFIGYETVLLIGSNEDYRILNSLPYPVDSLCLIIDVRKALELQGDTLNYED